MLGVKVTRDAHRAVLVGFGVTLFSCSAILGIEDRELRTDTGGGFGASSSGGANGGGAGTGARGGASPFDPTTCDAPTDACDQCFCDYCADYFTECEATGADCVAIADCIASSTCTDPLSCDADCRSVAIQAGAPDFAGQFGACVATCNSACAGGDACVNLAITGNPSSTECWSCACAECQGMQALDDCRDTYDCNRLAACIAQTGCTDQADCEMRCGYGTDPGLGDAGVQQLVECIQSRCPSAGCESISVSTDPTYDPQACIARYEDGIDYPYCMDCACNSCSGTTLSVCADSYTDCEAAVRCMTMTGCSSYADCTTQDRCADVFDRHLGDPTVVDDLGMCATGCSDCNDHSISSDPRDQCASQYGDLSCAPCMCNVCQEDVIRQCVDSADCRPFWECLQSSGCNGDECLTVCSDPMMPPPLAEQLLSCALNDCMSCSLGKGTGVPPGSETCNLLDDDGNGSVDEGYFWSLGTDNGVLSFGGTITELRVRAIPGRDEVAVAGILDNPGSPFLAVVSADGGILGGPYFPVQNASSIGVGADVSSAGVVTADDSCALGCPQLVYTDTMLYADRGPGPVDFGFPPTRIYDAAVYGSYWTTATLDGAGDLIVSWLDSGGTPLGAADVTLGGPWGARGAFDRRDGWAVFVVDRILPQGLSAFTFDLSVYAYQGGGELDPMIVAADGLAEGHAVALAKAPTAASDIPFAIFYGDGGPTIARVSGTALMTEYGPVQTQGSTPIDVVEIDGNFVTLSADASDIVVDRFTDGLDQPYAEMTPTYYSRPYPGAIHRLVKTSSRLLLFTATGPDLLVTELGCNLF